jgi:dTDP-4-dehydrorhamnose reductase
MKIILIGKNGQLGGEIIKGTDLSDFEVFPFDREEMDVSDPMQVEEKIRDIKPDALINTSAYHVLPKCEEHPWEAIKINCIAVGEMARLCKKYGAKFITYSTDYVFDGKKGAPYNEGDEIDPLQFYGVSKAAGEFAALNSYSEGSFIIRTCGLYGGKSGSPEKGGNFVLNIIKEGREKETVEVSSEQIVSPTYAGDLSKATISLLKDQAAAGIYHLVNEGYCSWYEFSREIFGLAGITTRLVPADRKGSSGAMKRPVFSALANTKAKTIGIELPSWREGLRSYFDSLDKLR